MSRSGIWATLGIDPTRDRAAIRRAYAQRLKTVHPEDDAAGFQALRAAYEQALAYASRGWAPREEIIPAQVREEVAARVDAAAEPAVDQLPERLVPRVRRRPPAPPEPEVAPEPVVEPELPAAPRPETFDQAYARLQRLLTPGAAPDADELERAMEAVLRSPALDELAVYLRAEALIAGLIVRTAPRSNRLVEPAVERFGWTDDGRRRHTPPAEAAVLRRLADLRYVANLRKRTHPLRGALKDLERVPRRGETVFSLLPPGRLGNVRTLLDAIRRDHPSVLADLPADAVKGWTDYFGNPRFTPAWIWTALGCAVVVSFALSAPGPGGGFSPRFPLTLSIALAAAAAFVVLKFYLIDRPAQHWAEKWAWRAPPWVKLGWAPLGLALIALAALSPASDWTVAGIGVGAVAVAAWAAITGERLPAGRSQWPWWLRLTARNLPLFLWWTVLLSRSHHGAWPQVAVAVSGCAAAWGFGEQTLTDFWLATLTPRIRLGAFVGLILVSLGVTCAVIVQSPPLSPTPAALAAAASALALVHRLPAATARPFVFKPNLTTRGILRLVFLLAIGGPVLASVGVAALFLISWVVPVGTLIGLLAAFTRDRQVARAKPRP